MKLHPNSLPARIFAYFAANPDEELTLEQVTLKFGAPPGTVGNAVRHLRSLGFVEHVRVIRRPSKGRSRESAAPAE